MSDHRDNVHVQLPDSVPEQQEMTEHTAYVIDSERSAKDGRACGQVVEKLMEDTIACRLILTNDMRVGPGFVVTRENGQNLAFLAEPYHFAKIGCWLIEANLPWMELTDIGRTSLESALASVIKTYVKLSRDEKVKQLGAELAEALKRHIG